MIERPVRATIGGVVNAKRGLTLTCKGSDAEEIARCINRCSPEREAAIGELVNAAADVIFVVRRFGIGRKSDRLEDALAKLAKIEEA